MTAWQCIWIGAFIGVFGGVLHGYGWYLLSEANKHEPNVEEIVEKSVKESLENNILAFRDKLNYETNINDKRMQDGGRIYGEITWSNGPILDIGNPEELDKNRAILYTEYPDKFYFSLYDAYGKQYLLEGNSKYDPQITRSIEALWSSKSNFIAILIDGKILSKIQVSDLTIFHDSSKYRQIKLGGSFDDTGGSTAGSLKNLKIYTSKDL